jgi:hypothetical protein
MTRKSNDELNVMAKEWHAKNAKWWHDIVTGQPLKRNKGELLMLVITELAEAVEGIRKNLMDDHLPHRKMEEVEMADAVIRLLDYCGGFGVKISGFGGIVFSVGNNKAESVLEICYSVCDASNFNDHMIGYVIRNIENYCIIFGLDLWGAVAEKMEYNMHRADHKAEARLADGGKKF